MDISRVGGSIATELSTQFKQEDSTTESFKSVLNKALENKDEAELKRACIDFEGYFIQMMFKEMRKSVNTAGGLFPKSNSELIFQDMLDEETSKSAANAGGVGLADMMYKQLSREINSVSDFNKNA